MEWEAAGIVLDARLFGESDAIVAAMTLDHGVHRGLVRGGAARSRAADWQPGNLMRLRWTARLSDQLGAFGGEPIMAAAAAAMEEAWGLAILASACATAESALPERVPHPAAFHGLLRLIPRAPLGLDALPELVRWEAALLAELGYGLDLERCALTGGTDDLAYISPRTGRAVARAAAGIWEARLLRLPAFLIDADAPAAPADLRDGLRLTGHFLARDAFGQRHRPLPAARTMLADKAEAWAAEREPMADGSPAAG